MNNKVSQKLEIIGFKEPVKKSTDIENFTFTSPSFLLQHGLPFLLHPPERAY